MITAFHSWNHQHEKCVFDCSFITDNSTAIISWGTLDYDFITKLLVQSNLCITNTWRTKFLRLLEKGGRYKEELCITAKTVNWDIWSLYKGSIIFHLITHNTNKNKSACIFVRNKNYVVIKQHITNNFNTKIS